tara:strand:+ start:1633 stop:2265 length:633 start_codon:yes stop_codon:yes gene_type:complete
MPSDLQVDNIKDGSATKTLATLSSSAVSLHSDVTFPDGHIVQVKCTYDTTQENISSGTSSTAITNLKCNIIPKSASNTMLIHGHFYLGASTNFNGGTSLTRRLASASFSSSDTTIGSLSSQGISTSGVIRAQNFFNTDDGPDNDDASIIPYPYNYIDSGYDTVTEITYQMAVASSSSINVHYGRSERSVNDGRCVATMYIFEIQGTVAIS